jgi:hypothetical protein
MTTERGGKRPATAPPESRSGANALLAESGRQRVAHYELDSQSAGKGARRGFSGMRALRLLRRRGDQSFHRANHGRGAAVADACRQAGVYAIVGSAWREGDKLFDSALVIAPTGKVLERYHKIQLAERWPQPGDHLSVFKIDGVPCSVIICHDERYPELVRLPVLARSSKSSSSARIWSPQRA